MPSHKFTVDQDVELLRSPGELHITPGIYTIVRQLPAEANDCQYRVKSVRDGHQRVVRESQLASVDDSGEKRGNAAGRSVLSGTFAGLARTTRA